jgi:hypothetical protein
MPNTKTSPLVNLSAATNFSIKQLWLDDTVWLPGNPSGLYITSDRHLLNYLPLLGTSIKVLSFDTEHPIPINFPGNRTLPARINDVWRADLSRLHAGTIPSLELDELNIRLRVGGTTFQGLINDLTLAKCLRAAILLRARSFPFALKNTLLERVDYTKTIRL